MENEKQYVEGPNAGHQGSVTTPDEIDPAAFKLIESIIDQAYATENLKVDDDVNLRFAEDNKLREAITPPSIDGPLEFMIRQTELKPYDLSQFKPFETIYFGPPVSARVTPESLARFEVMEGQNSAKRLNELLATVAAQTNKSE